MMPRFDATATSEQVVEAFAPQVKGRTFVITGAGQASIGSLMAVTLARASPHHILIASRTAAKAEPVLAAIRETNRLVRATFVQVDLSDHDSVRRAAGEMLDATASRIDVLINSAGNMALKEYAVDRQGIEMQLSANHVGHFLLTNLLAPALVAAADANKELGARVVNLTSLGYLISPFRFDDCAFSGGSTYDLWSGYGQAKTANILFSFGLGQRLSARGVASFAAHPGNTLDTGLGSHLAMDDYDAIFDTTRRNTGRDYVFEEPRFRTYAQSGATPLAAALDPQIGPRSPALLVNSQIAETAEHASSPEAVEKLWKLSEKLVGQAFRY